MGKKIRKWLCVALAVVMMNSALPLISGAIATSAGGPESRQSSGQSPLKVEIKSDRDRYTLLGKMEFTATITNTSSATVEDISAQVLLGASLRPLANGSQFTATKTSLAPGESFSFRYYADLNGLKGLDNLLLPLFWVSQLFHGGKADIGNSNGSDYMEASKAVGLVSLFSGQYDVCASVRVWLEDDEEMTIEEVRKDYEKFSSVTQYFYEISREPGKSQTEFLQDIKSFLDQAVETGKIKKYGTNSTGITIKSFAGFTYVATWDYLLDPDYCNRQAIIPQPQVFGQAFSYSALSNRTFKIATLQPHRFDSQFDTPIVDNSAKAIVTANSNYSFDTNLANTNVTIEKMKNLSENKIIIMNSHGGMDKEQYFFVLGIPDTINLYVNDDYLCDAIAKRPRLIKTDSGYYAVTTAFFEKYWIDASFDNTLLYLGTCHGADDWNLWNVLEKKGISTLLAFTNSVFSKYDDNMCETIFQELAKGRTVEQAVDTAKQKHGHDDSNIGDRFTAGLATITGVFGFDWYDHMLTAELKLFGHEDWSIYKEYYTNEFGELGGVVKDKDTQAPLANVEVIAFDTANKEAAKMWTGTEGTFYFMLPEGQYNIRFRLAGYAEVNSKQRIERELYTLLLNPVYMQKELGGDDTDPKTGDDGTTNWDFIIPVTHQKTVPAGYMGIYTAQDLNNVRNNLSGNYILMNDIDLVSWGNWMPIGNNVSNYFSGIFNGNGYVIKNMVVSGYACAGLFGYTGGRSGAIINTGIVNAKVSALSGTSAAWAGGIVGNNSAVSMYSVRIDNCYNTGEVSVTAAYGSHAGGIVGNNYAEISNCYNTGEVTATTQFSYVLSPSANAGGIAGSNPSYEIKNCYNTGKVAATAASNPAHAGGIAGRTLLASNCYNTGTVSAATDSDAAYAGGIAGRSSAFYCYSTGIVSAISNYIPWDWAFMGGIVGGTSDAGSSNYHSCYYLNNVNNAIGNYDENYFINVNALTASQMQMQASFVGFDFTNTWAIDPAINNGYPYLRGMQP